MNSKVVFQSFECLLSRRSRNLYLLVILTSADVVQGQVVDPNYLFMEREDRIEGLVPTASNISNEKVELKSATIEYADDGSQNNGQSYALGFFVHDKSVIDIDILNVGSDYTYRMHPLNTVYLPGAHLFRWPSDIPKHFNIGVRNLSSYATISNSNSPAEVVVPIAIFSGTTKHITPEYRFSFKLQAQPERIKYQILDGATDQEVFSQLTESPDLIPVFSWKCVDASGAPVKSGRYSIGITVTFPEMPGMKQLPPIPLYYQFDYEPSLFDQIEKWSQGDPSSNH